MGSMLGPNGGTARWKKLSLRIKQRDNFRCYLCGGQGNAVDHIIPRALWPDDVPGVDDPSNLACICTRCNSRKGSRIIKHSVSPMRRENNKW